MDRQLQTTLPDGGQTTNCYSDISGSSCYSASNPISVTTTTKATSSSNLVSVGILDGLGRLKNTKLTSDPQGTVYTRTDYDPLWRKQFVWNPTRCDLTVDPPPS